MSKAFFEKFEIEPKGLETIPTKETEFKMQEVKLPEMPGVEVGIEETKDVVKAGVSLANAVINSLKDGKVTLADIPSFIAPLTKIPSALAGIGKVPGELENLSEEETAEIIALVKNELEVDDEHAKEIAGKAIGLMYDLYDFVKTVKN